MNSFKFVHVFSFTVKLMVFRVQFRAQIAGDVGPGENPHPLLDMCELGQSLGHNHNQKISTVLYVEMLFKVNSICNYV